MIKNYKGTDIRFIIVLIVIVIFTLGFMSGIFVEDYIRYRDNIILQCETLEDNRG